MTPIQKLGSTIFGERVSQGETERETERDVEEKATYLIQGNVTFSFYNVFFVFVHTIMYTKYATVNIGVNGWYWMK